VQGEAFFVKPFDVAELMDAIDRILGGRAGGLPHSGGGRCGLAGPALCQHPGAGRNDCPGRQQSLEVLEAMESFHPDLLLMDIYMPEISGVELARIIQQHRSYLGVPIVFLSAERDPVKQLEALGQGVTTS
jgi:DNA-binding response OmpR family regulator